MSSFNVIYFYFYHFCYFCLYFRAFNFFTFSNFHVFNTHILPHVYFSFVVHRNSVFVSYNSFIYFSEYHTCLGSAFFGLLAELDMTVLASKILTFILNTDELELNNNSFAVSKEAKLHIFINLSNVKEEYRYSDLILALSTFSKENKNSVYYRIIERIEAELKLKVLDMRVRDALSLLNAYSYSSRFHPG